MYECNYCNKRFEDPQIAYSRTIHDDKIITRDSAEFDEFEAIHSDHWYYCPNCGSEDITDLDELI